MNILLFVNYVWCGIGYFEASPTKNSLPRAFTPTHRECGVCVLDVWSVCVVCIIVYTMVPMQTPQAPAPQLLNTLPLENVPQTPHSGGSHCVVQSRCVWLCVWVHTTCHMQHVWCHVLCVCVVCMCGVYVCVFNIW